MSLALQWGEPSTSNIEDQSRESGFVYFDAVTSFTTSYKGQITKHPVDSGGNITDHFIRDNPVFTLAVVISPFDISMNSFLITDLEDTSPYNVRQPPTAVSVSSDDSLLKRFIPDVIGQFLRVELPEVTVDGARTDYTEQLKELLSGLIQRKTYNEATGQFDNIIQECKLYEYTGTQLKRVTNRLVVTNITFKEDTSTGNALYADITLEQVEYAYLNKTVIPKDVRAKAKTAQSGGKVDSTPQDAKNPDGTPAEKAPKVTKDDIDPKRTIEDKPKQPEPTPGTPPVVIP